MVRVLASARVHDRQVGGNTRYVRAVYPRLARHGVELLFARPDRSARDGRLRRLAYIVDESVVWPVAPPGDVDVIHFPADTGALVAGRTPVVSTIHGLATLHVDSVRSPVADAVWRRRVARLAAVSAHIITVSESSARDIAAFAPSCAGRITVIPHGIDRARFHPDRTRTDRSSLGRYDLPEEYFLYVGNLDPRKNLPRLAAAAGEVFARTGIPLVVSGAAAWGGDEILGAVQQTRGVRYLGRVGEEALLPLIQGATAFCFPSTYEGFGFPVLEAMACGVPVLCSDRGSLREVAKDAALVLPDIEVADIARGMLELAADADLRGELAERGLRNAGAYTWEKSAAAHAEVFVEAAS